MIDIQGTYDPSWSKKWEKKHKICIWKIIISIIPLILYIEIANISFELDEKKSFFFDIEKQPQRVIEFNKNKRETHIAAIFMTWKKNFALWLKYLVWNEEESHFDCYMNNLFQI